MPPDPQAPAAPGRALRTTAIIVAVIAATVLVGGIVTRLSQASNLRKQAEADGLVTVVVRTPAAATDGSMLELPGRIEAYARAPIYARVSGYLKAWYADIGTRVKAGQLLAEIETPDLDQQLLQAEAELANAKANAALAETTARRWQSLLATDSVSKQEVEEKTADLAAKQSEVRALEANVERYQATRRFARIVAPFDGVVTARATDVGALISVGSAQGTELFEVSDTSRLRVYVNVPQNYATEVHVGTTARLTVPERPGQAYGATVQAMSNAISAGSGSMLVQLQVDNAAGELLPGGFARVSFDLPAAAGTLTVPASALIFDKAGLRVATVGQDGRVALKPIKLARDNGATIDVAAGLEANDRVIESPPDGIADGEKVLVKEPTASSGASAEQGKRDRGKP